MNKPIKFIVAGCLALLATASVQAGTVDLNNKNDGFPQPNTWNTQFWAARELALDNGLPIVAIYSSSGCPHCNSLKTACNDASLEAWLKQTGIVFIYSESGGTQEKTWVKGTAETDQSAAPNKSGDFPYVRIFWPAGGVDSCFSGRSNQIPASGKNLGVQFQNAISSKLAAYFNGGAIIVDPPAPVVPVIGDEWVRARKIYGTVRDGDLIVGRLELSLGKVSKSGNKKGQAKASAKLMGLDGKSKAFRAGYCTVNTETVVDLGAGSLHLVVSGNSFSGTVNGLQADTTVVTGGAAQDGGYQFSMDQISEFGGFPVLTQFLPTSDQPLNLTVASSRWKLAGKAVIKWDRVNQQFFASRAGNEAGMSFAYNVKTGFFKGSFKIYTSKKVGAKTSNAAKATGFFSATRGNGIVTVKRSVFNCLIKPAQ